ncbi:hypothetical protein MHYP_G00260650 [Metynnis hypsauchen]
MKLCVCPRALSSAWLELHCLIARLQMKALPCRQMGVDHGISADGLPRDWIVLLRDNLEGVLIGCEASLGTDSMLNRAGRKSDRTKAWKVKEKQRHLAGVYIGSKSQQGSSHAGIQRLMSCSSISVSAISQAMTDVLSHG